ncbi:MAG: hypothetical protein OS112_10330 [Methanoregula sp.]|nr:MAG: hypothetical protein OS112_10330 [Methanoregula sp.]
MTDPDCSFYAVPVVAFLLFATILGAGCTGTSLTSPANDTAFPAPPLPVPEVPIADQGRPCQTNEEWHAKADQTGAWIDGFLIDEKTPDDEIRSIVNNYTRIVSLDIRISPPHYIGYYITVPESRFLTFRKMIEDNVSEWNMSFSSPMFGVIEPAVKTRGIDLVAPVFISYSDRMKEPDVFDNLILRNVSLMRTKVVRFDLSPVYTPQERDTVLHRLNADTKVLFVFKEYLEGVLC